MILRRLLAFLAIGCGTTGPASAERIVFSLSADAVAITSNYAGVQLVGFGVIERDGQSVARPGEYDVVVTVTGPREGVTVRRKEALGPIWINRSQGKFVNTPSALGVFSTRPLDDIASPALRQRFRLGIQAYVSSPAFAEELGRADDAYRAALARLKTRDGLYVENGAAVTFVSRDVFRAGLPVPATAPPGVYQVEASLLTDGIVVARQVASFELVKSGIEEQVSTLAREHPLLSGTIAASLSLLFGWLASVIFRRD